MPNGAYTFPAMEWHLAVATAGFGGFLLAGWSSMTTDAYQVLLSWAGEDAWGIFFLALGCAHAVALMAPGRVAVLARMAALIVAGVVFTTFGAGFLSMGAPGSLSTAVYTYPGFIASAAAVCLWRLGTLRGGGGHGD